MDLDSDEDAPLATLNTPGKLHDVDADLQSDEGSPVSGTAMDAIIASAIHRAKHIEERVAQNMPEWIRRATYESQSQPRGFSRSTHQLVPPSLTKQESTFSNARDILKVQKTEKQVAPTTVRKTEDTNKKEELQQNSALIDAVKAKSSEEIGKLSLRDRIIRALDHHPLDKHSAQDAPNDVFEAWNVQPALPREASTNRRSKRIKSRVTSKQLEDNADLSPISREIFLQLRREETLAEIESDDGEVNQSSTNNKDLQWLKRIGTAVSISAWSNPHAPFDESMLKVGGAVVNTGETKEVTSDIFIPEADAGPANFREDSQLPKSDPSSPTKPKISHAVEPVLVDPQLTSPTPQRPKGTNFLKRYGAVASHPFSNETDDKLFSEPEISPNRQAAQAASLPMPDWVRKSAVPLTLWRQRTDIRSPTSPILDDDTDDEDAHPVLQDHIPLWLHSNDRKEAECQDPGVFKTVKVISQTIAEGAEGIPHGGKVLVSPVSQSKKQVVIATKPLMPKPDHLPPKILPTMYRSYNNVTVSSTAVPYHMARNIFAVSGSQGWAATNPCEALKDTVVIEDGRVDVERMHQWMNEMPSIPWSAVPHGDNPYDFSCPSPTLARGGRSLGTQELSGRTDFATSPTFRTGRGPGAYCVVSGTNDAARDVQWHLRR